MIGLPAAISGVNTYWLRGYGDPPPQALIWLATRARTPTGISAAAA